MKVKVLNVLTVCVITLAVLSPGILVFSLVWGRHIELVKTQNLTYEMNNNIKANDFLNSRNEVVVSSANQSSISTFKPQLTTQKLTAVEQYQLATIIEWFFLLTPICVGLGIIVYDRYLVYRNAVFKQQVEMLERLWQQSIEQ